MHSLSILCLSILFNLSFLVSYRSSSPSSSTSSKSSCSHKSFFNLSFDGIVEDDCYSLSGKAFSENQNICLSNKENILHSDLSINRKKKLHRAGLMAKMAPTSTKLPGRQTNNSLSSITGQIVIDAPPTTSSGPSTSRKKKAKTEVWVILRFFYILFFFSYLKLKLLLFFERNFEANILSLSFKESW